MFFKYRRQFREVSRQSGDMRSNADPTDDATEDEVVEDESVVEEENDVASMTDAIHDQRVSDERVREMGLAQLLIDSLSRPDKEVKCSLGTWRSIIKWERGVTGIHMSVSPSSGDLIILHTDREKDKLRGAKRNAAVQKLVVVMGSLWSVWVTTPTGSPARLHLALSHAPPCMMKIWTGNTSWVRRDDRRMLEDASTCNIIVLHGQQDKLRLQSILQYIRGASSSTKSVPVQMMSYRAYLMPALVARAESWYVFVRFRC